MPNKPQGTTDFRPQEHRTPLAVPTAATTPTHEVYVDPGAAPKVAEYVAGMAARANARRLGALLPKYNEPVGGAPLPPIPRLDGVHEEGRTMAEQAEHVNSPPILSQRAEAHRWLPGDSIVEPPSMVELPGGQPAQPRSRSETARGLGLMTTDMLPAEAQQDPEFQRGNGAMFAVSQPGLALRYGVVRNGQRLMPQQLREQASPRSQAPQAPGLRPETVQGLKDLQELSKQQQMTPEQRAAVDAKAESEVEEGPAGASSKVGAPMSEEEAQRRIELMDSFDYDSLRQAINVDLLNNKHQRDLIESRLEELDITDIILKNRVTQRVPIVPGKFEVTYRSMTGSDDLALKRLLMQESKSVEVTERFLLDKYAFMAIACGVVAVNSNNLPEHLNNQGDFDESSFWKKFEWVMKRPLHMLSSIGVNHTWFEMRVRKLFVAEKVGNG
jgi:hypothetical protein